MSWHILQLCYSDVGNYIYIVYEINIIFESQIVWARNTLKTESNTK